MVMTRTTQTVRIGSAEIGSHRPAYIVAEAGVNHNGDLETAAKLARVATEAGANAIKFQAFTAQRLTLKTAPAVSYQPAATTQHQMLRDLELTPDEFAALRDRCRQCEIEFLATPFSPQDVRMLIDLDVRALKLASTEIVNEPLIDVALATGLPLIVSTGAATADEIDRAVDWIDRAGARDRLILMHCVSAYPVDVEQVNLRAVTTLARRYDCRVGFSDHTTSTTIGGLAVAAGACVIEKHFTLGQTQEGPDHAFSLEPSDLEQYVKEIRRAERICSTGAIGVLDCEQEVRTLARQSVVAARDLKAGETLTAEALTTKRPGTGISPADLKALIGRTVTRDIPQDTPLTRTHLA